MGGELVSEPEVIALFALVGVLFTAVATVLGIVLANRQKALEVIIGTLQTELSNTRAEVIANKAAIRALMRRDRALVNYVHRLRRHINDEIGPPAPDWPDELGDDLDISAELEAGIED